jgi:hypothetical protein
MSRFSHLPKTLDQLCQKKDKYIDEAYKDSDGYWIYLHPEYICGETETLTIHEYTIAELRRSLASIMLRADYFNEE